MAITRNSQQQQQPTTTSLPPLIPQTNTNNQQTQSTIHLPTTTVTTTATNGSDYEKTREQRIKENRERLQKLGIVDLSLQFKSISSTPSRRTPRSHSTPLKSPSLAPNEPRRRSSRLQNAPPVTYTEPKEEKSRRSRDIVLEEGAKPEFYTKEHEKLLGSTERPWTLFVDGYANDRTRIYDPVQGKTCHQCRQKTLGLRTQCCKCNLVQGQFCGDCLFMRYGEHVVEANENPNWICPPCRGICNCSLCRNAKGWAPTGALYKRISNLGYKSVAHFLVETRRAPPKEDNVSDNQQPAKKSLPFEGMEIVHGDDKAGDETKTVTLDIDLNRVPNGVRRSGRKSKIENASVSDEAECEPVPDNRSPERVADKENADVVEELMLYADVPEDSAVADKAKDEVKTVTPDVEPNQIPDGLRRSGRKSKTENASVADLAKCEPLPNKRSPEEAADEENADVAVDPMMNAGVVEDASVTGKKSRGRPRKRCDTENADVAEDAPVTEKRGRGRPKKLCKTENAVVTEDAPVTEKKSRGRPRKNVQDGKC